MTSKRSIAVRLTVVGLLTIVPFVLFVLRPCHTHSSGHTNAHPSHNAVHTKLSTTVSLNRTRTNFDNATDILHDGRLYLRSPRLNVADGTQFAKTLRVVLCGTIRQRGRDRDILDRSIAVMKRLASYFKDYAILIVENDSKTSARKKLLAWAAEDSSVLILGCGVNAPSCSLRGNISSARDIEPGYQARRTFEDSRAATAKMARIRNIYLTYALRHYGHFDFLAVHEMDNAGDVTWRAFASFVSTLRLPHVEALCASELAAGHHALLRDPCTLVLPPIPRRIPYHLPLQWHRFVSAVLEGARSDRPLRVQSCYQALAFYRISALVAHQAMYRGAPPGLLTCEHNELNYRLSNLYIDKTFVFTINSYG